MLNAPLPSGIGLPPSSLPPTGWDDMPSKINEGFENDTDEKKIINYTYSFSFTCIINIPNWTQEKSQKTNAITVMFIATISILVLDLICLNCIKEWEVENRCNEYEFNELNEFNDLTNRCRACTRTKSLFDSE